MSAPGAVCLFMLALFTARLVCMAWDAKDGAIRERRAAAVNVPVNMVEPLRLRGEVRITAAFFPRAFDRELPFASWDAGSVPAAR